MYHTLWITTLCWSRHTSGWPQNALKMNLQSCSFLFFKSIMMFMHFSVRKGNMLIFWMEIDACWYGHIIGKYKWSWIFILCIPCFMPKLYSIHITWFALFSLCSGRLCCKTEPFSVYFYCLCNVFIIKFKFSSHLLSFVSFQNGMTDSSVAHIQKGDV